MYVTLFVVGSIEYSPILLPSGPITSCFAVGSNGFPSWSNSLALPSWIATVSFVPFTVTVPPVNDTVPSWVCPWGAFDSAACPCGLTGTMFGV